MTPRTASPSLELIQQLSAIVGPANALTHPDDQSSHLREWREKYSGKTPLVLRPASPAEVSAIMTLAHAHNIGIVPQGGNTGLVGGQIPSQSGDEVVVSLSRLKRVRDIDVAGGTLTVEAGVTLAETQSIAEASGRLFPLSLASEGSANVGGALATNAGGTTVLAYGNARNLCLGLEVVLADGRIWNGLKRLKKDNTGYDVRDLIIGSEGTLGIITAAVLKILPRPTSQATALVAVDSARAVLELYRRCEDAAGTTLTAFEFWTRLVMQFALTHMPGARDPLSAPHPWYVLIELSSLDSEERTTMLLDRLLDGGLKAGLIRDGVVASSSQQRAGLWALRESFSEAQKGAGGSIKHDVSVPVASIPKFLDRAAEVVQQISPGARPVPFGHFGDGNVHYNVTQPEGADKDKFLRLWDPMSEAIHRLVSEFDGSFSAEHGVGQMKRRDLVRYKSSVEIEMMRAIKNALDPKGILNPGKVL